MDGSDQATDFDGVQMTPDDWYRVYGTRRKLRTDRVNDPESRLKNLYDKDYLENKYVRDISPVRESAAGVGHRQAQLIANARYAQSIQDYLNKSIEHKRKHGSSVRLDGKSSSFSKKRKYIFDRTVDAIPFGGSLPVRLPEMIVKHMHMGSLKDKLDGKELLSANDLDIIAQEIVYAEEQSKQTMWGEAFDLMTMMPAFASQFMSVGGIAKKGAAVTVGKLGGGMTGRAATKLTEVGVRASMNSPMVTQSYFGLVDDKVAAKTSNGRTDIGIIEGDGYIESIPKAFANAYVETATEYLGAGVNKLPIWESMKSSLLKKYAAKLGLGVGEAQSKFGKFVKEVGYDGVIQEFLEERAGEIIKGATGLEDNFGTTGVGVRAAMGGDVSDEEWEDAKKQAGAELIAFAVTGLGVQAGSSLMSNKKYDEVKKAAELKLNNEPISEVTEKSEFDNHLDGIIQAKADQGIDAKSILEKKESTSETQESENSKQSDAVETEKHIVRKKSDLESQEVEQSSPSDEIIKKADAPQGDAFGAFGGGKISLSKNRQDTIPDEIKVDDSAVEQRMVDAQGIQKKTFFDRVKEIGESIVGVTRSRRFIPQSGKRGEFLAAANDTLRRFQNINSTAFDDANRLNAAIVEPLGGPKQLAVFGRLLQVENMVAAREAGQPLRFGFKSDAQLNEYRDKVRGVAQASPEVMEAMANRKIIVKDLVDQLVDGGLLPESALENHESYYHQQVLAYEQSNRFAKQQAQLKKKGFQKKRTLGESLDQEYDYNTNLIEAEMAWMTDAKTVLKVQELHKEIGNYDISKELKAKAEKEGKEDWKQGLPDDYALWAPEPGNVFYPALTIPERVLEQMELDILGTYELSKEEVGQVMALGGNRPQMALPIELVQQLESMQKGKPRMEIAQAFKKVNTGWKEWALHNPLRVIGYNIRNTLGDADVALAGDPAIMKNIPWAEKQMRDYVFRSSTLSEPKVVKLAKELGVIDSSFETVELPDINKFKEFDRFRESKGLVERLNFFMKYRGFVSQFSKYREGIMRLAAFKHYLGKLESNTLTHYGASRKANVDSIRETLGNEKAAAKLARDLIGDYGDISVAGNALRDFIWPFWAFAEINLKRYPILLANAIKAGNAKQAGAVGVLAGARAAVWSAAIASRLGMLYGISVLYNLLMHPEEEEELPEYERANPHIILGRTPDGDIQVFRNHLASGDFLEWFGVNDLISKAPQYADGRLDTKDIPSEVGQAILNKIYGGIYPVWKLGIELPTGKSSFPDAMNPRPKPRDEILMNNTLGLNDEYKWFKSTILGSGDSVKFKSFPDYLSKFTGVGKVNPDSAALMDTYSFVERYKRQNGLDVSTAGQLSKYRHMRYAAINGDYGAFVRARDNFIKQEGDKAEERFVRFLKRMDPLKPELNETHREKFLESLNSDDRLKVDRSRKYATRIQEQLAVWWEAAERESEAKRRKPLLKNR